MNKPTFGIPDLTPVWEYLKRQADALERLADAVERIDDLLDDLLYNQRDRV